jgi:RNA polymerase sigma-70 factor (ECF subfamily)
MAEIVGHDSALLDRARRGDEDAFQHLAHAHRAELLLHCYRMLGSVHDAEDLVQETMLRAWRALARFEARTSFRRWLYRIATNACLNALTGRARAHRVLPATQRPPNEGIPGLEPAAEIAWLEPYPDAALADLPDDAPGPDARYEMREAVRLAFVAAIQLLPPRQRAVLLLRDVLGWSASEVAALLDGSVASVNAALQRARATMARQPSPESLGTARAAPTPDDAARRLLERYVHSWEHADVDTFVALLRDDVVLSMPPWTQWFRGREAVAAFVGWAMRPGGRGSFRLLPIRANDQPAFAFYTRAGSGVWRAHSIQVLELDGGAVRAMTSFISVALFPTFVLPQTLT